MSNMRTTLYPIHDEPHEIKFFSNAYDDLTRTSGTFCEIEKAIKSANEFICITSWNNFFTKDLGMNKLLIELLLEAAARGVKIFILMWARNPKDKLIGDSGIEDNLIYFQSSNNPNIFYKKAIRNGSYLERKFYSHHQKIFVTEEIAFIGGLDFVPKVADSREHADVGGKMWHDAACSARGPVIQDILEMFYARWCAQPDNLMLFNDNIKAIKHLKSYTQLKDKKMEHKLEEKKETNKNIQFLVCLTQQDYLLPKKAWPLKSATTTEINSAYLKCIKEAKKYIIMANQYFISLYDRHYQSANKISFALIDRIVRAHQQNKQFHIYFILTAVPGNDLLTLKPLTILRKEWKTLKFLFNQINNFTDNNAEKYITVIELGKVKELESERTHKKQTYYHQIYIHAKYLLSEDSLMIGSANFNERSLSGDRDSESVLKIEGYTDEIMDFRNRLIEEYFGTNTFERLKKESLLNDLGSDAARSIIEDNIANKLKLLPKEAHYQPNIYNLPLIPAMKDADKKETISEDSTVASMTLIQETLATKPIGSSSKEEIMDFKIHETSQRSQKLEELKKDNHQLSGCAFPWGLISKNSLLKGNKPSRVPEKSPYIARIGGFLGAGKTFR